MDTIALALFGLPKGFDVGHHAQNVVLVESFGEASSYGCDHSFLTCLTSPHRCTRARYPNTGHRGGLAQNSFQFRKQPETLHLLFMG